MIFPCIADGSYGLCVSSLYWWTLCLFPVFGYFKRFLWETFCLFYLLIHSFIHFCSSHAWLPISIQCAGQSRVRVSVTSRFGVEEIADGTPTPTNQIDTKNIWVVYKDPRAPVTAGIEHIKYVLQSDAWEIDGIIYGFNEQSPARGGGRPCFHMLIGWALLLCVVSWCTLRLPSFQPVTHRRLIGTEASPFSYCNTCPRWVNLQTR